MPIHALVSKRLTLPVVCLLALLATLSPAHADEFDALLKQYLGENILSEQIDAPVLEEPADYFPMRESQFTYDLRNQQGQNAGRVTERMEHLKRDSFGCHWVRNVSDAYSDYIMFDDTHNLTLMSQLRHDKNRLTLFSPTELIIPDDFKPGSSVKRSLNIRVCKMPNTRNAEYQGVLNQTVTYHGAYRIKVPAGTYDTILIRRTLKGQVGPARIDNSTATFYAKNIGKVASLEHRDVSALIIYNKDTYVGKVLKASQQP